MPLADRSVVLNIILVLLLLCRLQRRLQGLLKHLWQTWQQHRPQRWKPQSPRECQHCQAGLGLQILRIKADVRPYCEYKSRRGCKKRVGTGGFACPQLDCEYYGVTDASLHALVGYGRHNGIQRFKCQACTKVFTSRVNTPLYYLKTLARSIGK